MNKRYNKSNKVCGFFLLLLFCNITYEKIEHKKYMSYKYFFQNMKDEIIETDRCYISLTTDYDTHDLAKNFLNEEIIGFFDTSIIWPKTVDEAMRLLSSRLKKDKKTYYFTIKLKDTEESIGQIGFNLEKKNVLWVCYWLGPKYHRKGYMSEVSLNLVELIFKSCEDLNTIILRVDNNNEASKGMALKLCKFIKNNNKSYIYTKEKKDETCFTRDKNNIINKELVIFKIVKN